MKKTSIIFSFLLLCSNLLLAQEDAPKPPSELEILITNIQPKIDVEKRFDFSRANSKEKQLSDLKTINSKLKKDLKAAEDLSAKLINQFELIYFLIPSSKFVYLIFFNNFFCLFKLE